MGSNDGTSAILREVINCAVDSPEVYANLFAMALQENEASKMLEVLREKFHSIGKPDTLNVLESLEYYIQLVTNEGLKEYFELTKKFVLALDKEPSKREQFIAYWLKKTAEKNVTSLRIIDRLSFANIYLLMQDYLGI